MPPPAVLERRIGLDLDDHRGGHPGDRHGLAAEPPQLAGTQLGWPRVVIGTDDPTALAVAVTVTDDVLIGEELFATSAYLEGKASQIASLQLQDILRWIVVLFILGTAVYQLV